MVLQVKTTDSFLNIELDDELKTGIDGVTGS
jgi:hypothetical protein